MPYYEGKVKISQHSPRETRNMLPPYPWDQKTLYTSVEVTPAPVQVPTQRPLFPSLTSVVG